MKTMTSLQRYVCYATLVGLAVATADYARGALANGDLNAASVSSQALATPTGWTVAASRAISGTFNDGASSEGFANANVPDPGGAFGLFFKPFTGNVTDGDVSVHLYQDNPGSVGVRYTLTGWAGAEANYVGLDPLSGTRSEFALEFLDSGSAILLAA